MKKTVRFLFALVLLAAVAAGAVYLYYLPMPEPVVEEELDYREVVRHIVFDREQSLEEWEEKKLSRKPTRYSWEQDETRGYIRAVSDGGASGLYLKENLSHRDRPYVKWSWKAVKFPEGKKNESLESKAEFDFAAQVYVLFYSRMVLKSKGIQYVWTREIPAGTSVRSPYTNNIKMLVLQSGEPGEWKTEERDIARDYLELFGSKLDKDIVAIAFMTDADSTDTSAEAWFTDIEMGYLPLNGEEKAESNISGQ